MTLPTELMIFAFDQIQHIGHILRQERENQGLTQQQLGDILGASVYSIHTWEKAKKAPTAPHLLAWAHTLGKPLTLPEDPP